MTKFSLDQLQAAERFYALSCQYDGNNDVAEAYFERLPADMQQAVTDILLELTCQSCVDRMISGVVSLSDIDALAVKFAQQMVGIGPHAANKIDCEWLSFIKHKFCMAFAVRMRDTAHQSPENFRASMGSFHYAPESFPNEAHDMAVEMGILPAHTDGVDDRGQPVYSQDEIVDRLGMTMHEVPEFILN